MKFVVLDSVEKIDEQHETFKFIKEINRFKMLFSNINFPVTLVIEQNYSDRDYKDSYYHFYASKFHTYSKYSYRIAFFQGNIDKDSFFDKSFKLQDFFIGVVTIRPLSVGSIGKTLLDPKKPYAPT